MIKILTSNNLSEVDKKRAKQLLGWFKEWKQKGRLPMTQKYLIDNLKSNLGWDYNEHNFGALINYIRLELDEWIISSPEGYNYAITKEEKEKFIEYYESITLPRLEVLNWAKKKYIEELKLNQLNIFDYMNEKEKQLVNHLKSELCEGESQ